MEQQNEQPRQVPNLFSNGNSYARNHQQQRFYVHSNTNGINFGGFNGHSQFGDEQLLEGLGQEGRLF